jgi:hypothetical protein
MICIVIVVFYCTFIAYVGWRIALYCHNCTPWLSLYSIVIIKHHCIFIARGGVGPGDARRGRWPWHPARRGSGTPRSGVPGQSAARPRAGRRMGPRGAAPSPRQPRWRRRCRGGSDRGTGPRYPPPPPHPLPSHLPPPTSNLPPSSPTLSSPIGVWRGPTRALAQADLAHRPAVPDFSLNIPVRKDG